MLIRYKKEEDGSRTPIAEIYGASEHAIIKKDVDIDAIWVIRKLKQSGFEAYIVGGAVRDLLLGRVPKDFDISTSASPRQVQKLFWNARIIGKRFKLVHLLFKDKILEVSTFRSGSDVTQEGSSIYGTIEQDAKRRDFSLNALYYDPLEDIVLDFNRAMGDIKKRKVRSVLPLSTSFIEDPVRMIRAVKYACTTHFSLQHDVKRSIKKHARELVRISSSRITEEVMKILSSGDASAIMGDLKRYKLLVSMLPCISVHEHFGEVLRSLSLLDENIKAVKRMGSGAKEPEKGEMLYALVSPLIFIDESIEDVSESFKEIFQQVKTLITPITPPNYDVEKAVLLLFKEKDIVVPKSCLKARRPLGNSAALAQRRPKSGKGREGVRKSGVHTYRKKSTKPAKEMQS